MKVVMFFLHSVSAVVDVWMRHSVFFFNCRKCNLEKISHCIAVVLLAFFFKYCKNSNYNVHTVCSVCSFSPPFPHPTQFRLRKKTEWVGVEAWYYQCTSILPNLYTVVTLTFFFFFLTAASHKNMHNGRILWLFLISIACKSVSALELAYSSTKGNTTFFLFFLMPAAAKTATAKRDRPSWKWTGIRCCSARFGLITA